MKKVLKIIIFIVILSLALIIYISYTVDHNEEETHKLETKITKHYNTKEEISNVTQYNNYYIVKTASKVIVLSNDYKPVLEEDLSKLSNKFTNQNLIYKTNKLIFEKKVLEDSTLTYEYYDAISGELIDKTTLEQQ